MILSNCAWSTCGPCSVSGSNGSPTTASLRLRDDSSRRIRRSIFSSTKSRRPGAAALPLVEVEAEVRPVDGRVEVGVGEDDVRALAAQLEGDPLEFVCAAASMMRLSDLSTGEGDLVDVHVSCDAAPAVGPKPGTILITPSGKPASSSSSPTLRAVSGVCSAGFITTVHPAAKAGPTSRPPSTAGNSRG